jgi:hypothetical protein
VRVVVVGLIQNLIVVDLQAEDSVQFLLYSAVVEEGARRSHS